MTLALATALFAAAWAWSLRRWWMGLRLVLVLLVVEGAIRKWLLPGQQQIVYLVKDALLVAVYIGFLMDRARVRRVTLPAPLRVTLLLGVLWGAFEVFNPRLPSILVGVFGWKAYFGYIPLLWVVPAAFRDLGELERFLRRYVLLVLPVVALGVLQFRAPVGSELNRYAWGEGSETRGIATFGEGGAARVTGTFSYITGFSIYLTVIGVLALALLAARGFRWRGNVLLWATLGAVPLGVLLSGSRGPLILLAGSFPALAVLGRRGGAGVLVGVSRLLVAGALLAVFVSYVGAPALEAFTYRVRGTEEDLSVRVLAPFRDPLELATEVGFFGYGVGATHQAASSLVPDMRPESWLDGLLAEVESSRVMIEMGPVGFVLHYGFRTALAVLLLIIALRLADARARALGLGAALFCISQLPGSIVMNVTAGLYFYFLAGAALLARSAGERGAPSRAASCPRALAGAGPLPSGAAP